MIGRKYKRHYEKHHYTPRMVFSDFRKKHPHLWERGTTYSPFEFRKIIIWIPSKGKLIYDHFHNRVLWQEYWGDREDTKESKEDRQKRREGMYERFVREIDIYQKETGTSQSGIAEISGVSRQKINEYMNGRHIPKISTMEKICESLGINI